MEALDPWLKKYQHYYEMIPDLRAATIICINADIYQGKYDSNLVSAAWQIIDDLGGPYYPSEWVKEIGDRMSKGMSYDEAVNDLPALQKEAS